jgi:hypothetical protein
MKTLVYTALSRHSAYAKEFVCAHAFKNGVVPLNPFSMFGYFLFDLVDRDLVRGANARVITAVDEVWSYGPIADGCLAEILQAQQEHKPVRFFSVATTVGGIRQLEMSELEFEDLGLKSEFEKSFRF